MTKERQASEGGLVLSLYNSLYMQYIYEWKDRADLFLHALDENRSIDITGFPADKHIAKGVSKLR